MKTTCGLRLVLICAVLVHQLHAQTIRVSDALTIEKIPGAIVVLVSDDHVTRQGTTNIDGEIVFDSINRKQFISVRMTGYQIWSDSVDANMHVIDVCLVPRSDSLNEVVITAQYDEADPMKTVQPVRVINRERIDAQGAQNLNDVMSTELNIRRSQDQVLGSSMSMQGLSGENVKILIDGVPVIGRLNGSIDLSQINLANVERIEIVEGPLSVNYGTNALAGAVNLITKKSEGNTLSIQSDNYYESSGNYNFTGRIGGRYRNTVASLSGGRNFFDGWSPWHKPFYVDWQPVADTTRFDTWKPRAQLFGSLYVCRHYNRGSIGIMGDAFHETTINRGIPRSPYCETAFDDFYQTRRLSLSVNWKHQLNDQIGLQFIGAASDFRRIKNSYYRDLITLEDELITTPGMQDTSGFALYMLRAAIIRSGDSLKFRFEAGLDLNTEFASGQRIENLTQWIGDYAMYVTGEYKPVKNLALRSGLRYAYNTAYKSPLIPSMHIRYDINTHIFIRTSYATGFRAPSLKELYFYFVDINHNIRGNENLKAENSDNLIASLNFYGTSNKHRWLFTVSGYYNDIRNLITLAIVSGTEYTYVNIGKYKTIGGGLSAEFRTHHVTINTGLVYGGRYNILQDEHNVNQFSWSPEARLSVTWNTGWHDIACAMFYKYTGVTPGFSADENGNVFNTNIDEYHIADAAISKKWLKGKLITEAGIRNIADVRNVNSTAIGSSAHSAGGALSVGTGRQYFFSVRWSISYNKKEK